MSSYFRLRHSRSMNTLSIQRPRPSIEMRMPAAASMPVKSRLVNWLPWTPFCLSSGDLGLIDRLVAPHDEGEDLAGDVAFQGPNGFKLRMPFSNAFGHIFLGFRIGT